MEGTQAGNSGVFNNIADAVAELERREAAREPEEAKDDAEATAEEADEEESSSAEQAADEDSDEVATEDEDQAEEQAKTSIEFDGKTLEIPKGTPPELVEAVQKLGNDLKADYTRKTQAVAEEKKVIESAKQRTMADFQQLQQSQQALAQMAQALIGAEPDLSLAQTDPHSYLVQKGLYEQRVNQFRALMQQNDQLQQHQQQELQAKQAEFQQEQAAQLLKAMPELQQPEKFQAFRAKAIDAGSKYGFTPEEVAGVTDHRMALVLRDLAKFHAQQKQVGEVKTKLQNVPPKVAKPGAAQQGDGSANRRAEAKREFMKSDRGERALRKYLAATS